MQSLLATTPAVSATAPSCAVFAAVCSKFRTVCAWRRNLEQNVYWSIFNSSHDYCAYIQICWGSRCLNFNRWVCIFCSKPVRWATPVWSVKLFVSAIFPLLLGVLQLGFARAERSAGLFWIWTSSTLLTLTMKRWIQCVAKCVDAFQASPFALADVPNSLSWLYWVTHCVIYMPHKVNSSILYCVALLWASKRYTQ